MFQHYALSSYALTCALPIWYDTALQFIITVIGVEFDMHNHVQCLCYDVFMICLWFVMVCSVMLRSAPGSDCVSVSSPAPALHCTVLFCPAPLFYMIFLYL